jgi:hypothetical protein
MKKTISLSLCVFSSTAFFLFAVSDVFAQLQSSPVPGQKVLSGGKLQLPTTGKPWTQTSSGPSTPVVTQRPLADTGQRLCYNNTQTIQCPSPGEAYYGQDAQYGWDTVFAATAPRFTRSTSTAAEPIVTDGVTGYVWQGCTAGLSGIECGTGTIAGYVWDDAVAYCDGLSWGGQSDWRLPNFYELESTADLGRFHPAIDPTAFPATPGGSPGSFWTSSVKTWPMTVSFEDGVVSYDTKTKVHSARCVRGEPKPAPSALTRNTSTAGQPVVADSVNQLEWQGCAGGLSGDACETGNAADTYLGFDAALSYCEDLSWGGKTDWRMPNRRELLSILYLDSSLGVVINQEAFPATPLGTGAGSYYWTSTTHAYFVTFGDINDRAPAWIVDFSMGTALKREKESNKAHVRCVRGGL